MKLLMYVAPWCNTCHSLEPIVQKLAEEEHVKLEVVDLGDIDEGKRDHDHFSSSVITLPTLVAADDTGHGEYGRLAGAHTPVAIRDFIRSF